MLVTLFGIVMDSKDEHSLKTLSTMLCKPLDSVAEVKDEHSEKA